MSLIPQRQSDMKESNRQSRIAMPTRNSSSKRCSSHDNRLLSATKPKRSLSATPLRTPSMPSARKGNNILFTAEKGEDKKLMQYQTIKILEYLKCVDEFNIGMNSQLNNLRSITTKQFIQIITHFIKIICGNRCTIGSNYVEDLSKVLVLLEYPHSINKSWFKTPNAPHAYNHVLTLFNWFIDMVYAIEIDDFEKDYMVQDDFPTVEYALIFLKEANEGFLFWNQSEDDKFNELKQILVDKKIQIQTNFISFQALDNEVEKIRKERDDIVKNSFLIKNGQKNKELNDILIEKLQALKENQEAVEKNQYRLQNLQKTFFDMKQDKLVLEESIRELQEKIENQKLTQNQKDSMISEIGVMKQFFVTKTVGVKELQDMSLDYQIQLGRLKQRTFETITTFNNLVHKLSIAVNEILNIDFKSLTIPSNHNQNNIEEFTVKINNIELALNNIKTVCNSNIENNLDMIKNYDHKKNLLLVNKTNLDEKIIEMTKWNEKVNRTAKDLELKNINLKQIKENLATAERLGEQLRLCSYDLMIMLKNAKILETAKTAEKEKLLKSTMDYGHTMLRAKKEYIDKLRETVTELAHSVEELDLFFEKNPIK